MQCIYRVIAEGGVQAEAGHVRDAVPTARPYRARIASAIRSRTSSTTSPRKAIASTIYSCSGMAIAGIGALTT